MNPGTLTSPVKGDVLEQAVALRALGWQWDQIAAELRKRTGIERITGPMVGAVVRRQSKEGLPGPSVSKGQLPKADAVSHADAGQVVKDGGLATKRTAPAQAGATPNNLPAPVVHTTKSRAEGDTWAPAIRTDSKTHGGNTLVISDPQEPYALENVVAFLRRQRSEFNIARENVVHVGDEADFLYGSRFPVDPDNEHSAVGELKWLRDRMKVWYAEFPKLRLCISNHTDRWYKKAAGAQIPSQLVRARNEILQAPQEWVWADHWDFLDGKMPWRCEHGHNGAQSTRIRAIENGISTAHGHWHSKAGAEWAHTSGGQLVWGLATGCLIDAAAIAFKYTKRDRYKPIIGCGVVLDGGRKPLFVPYDGTA